MSEIPRGPGVPAWVTTAAINTRKREAKADPLASCEERYHLTETVTVQCSLPAGHGVEHEACIAWVGAHAWFGIDPDTEATA